MEILKRREDTILPRYNSLNINHRYDPHMCADDFFQLESHANFDAMNKVYKLIDALIYPISREEGVLMKNKIRRWKF